MRELNAWQKHVKVEMKNHPGKPLREVLKIAKVSYKGGKK